MKVIGGMNTKQIMPRRISALVTMLVMCALIGLSGNDAFADSTLHISIDNSTVSMNALANNTSGTFVKSGVSTITAYTDHITGYTLKIMGNNSDYDKLIDSNNSDTTTNHLDSITSATTEEVFKAVNNTAYNGKWGYLPSKHCTGTTDDTCAANTSFLPAPSTTGSTLDVTTAANVSSPNSYTLAIGARVDSSVKMGSYTNTYNVIMVANAIPYSITYNDGVVTNMPTDVAGTSQTTTVAIDSKVPVRSGYTFLGWCAGTVTNTNGTDSCSGTTYAAGSNYTLDGASSNALSLTAMWEIPKATIATATYLQDVEECPSTLTTGQVYSLKDSRDEQSYNVAKLADGKCWMTTNLNLAGGTVLSSDKSDVPSTNYYTLPASSTSGFSDNTVAYVYNSGNATSYCSSSGCYSYYSWLAATAGGKDSSGNAVSTNGYNAAYSICPKGWRLPTSTTSNANAQTSPNWKTGDWYALATAYGANLESSYSESAATFYNNAGPGTTPNFLLAGYCYNGSCYTGSYGYYWSSTANSSTLAYYLYFRGFVYSAGSGSRRYGDSVRCVSGS